MDSGLDFSPRQTCDRHESSWADPAIRTLEHPLDRLPLDNGIDHPAASLPAPPSAYLLLLQPQYSVKRIGKNHDSCKLCHTWTLRLPGETEYLSLELRHSRRSGQKRVFVDGKPLLATSERRSCWTWEHPKTATRLTLISKRGCHQLLAYQSNAPNLGANSGLVGSVRLAEQQSGHVEANRCDSQMSGDEDWARLNALLGIRDAQIAALEEELRRAGSDEKTPKVVTQALLVPEPPSEGNRALVEGSRSPPAEQLLPPGLAHNPIVNPPTVNPVRQTVEGPDALSAEPLNMTRRLGPYKANDASRGSDGPGGREATPFGTASPGPRQGRQSLPTPRSGNRYPRTPSANERRPLVSVLVETVENFASLARPSSSPPHRGSPLVCHRWPTSEGLGPLGVSAMPSLVLRGISTGGHCPAQSSWTPPSSARPTQAGTGESGWPAYATQSAGNAISARLGAALPAPLLSSLPAPPLLGSLTNCPTPAGWAQSSAAPFHTCTPLQPWSPKPQCADLAAGLVTPLPMPMRLGDPIVGALGVEGPSSARSVPASRTGTASQYQSVIVGAILRYDGSQVP